jgi:hypothetical protein
MEKLIGIGERPARTCADCSLCCKLLGVPEIGKPAGVWCDLVRIGESKTPAGCSTYSVRPKACTDFECLWLQSAAAGYPMDEDMRPDLCKVVFGGSIDGMTSVVYVDPANPTAWRRGRVEKVIRRLLKRFDVVIVCGESRTLLAAEKRDGGPPVITHDGPIVAQRSIDENS